MTGSIELRDEPADGAVSRTLVAEYAALVHERLALSGVQPGERFFIDADIFGGPGSAWLVAYEDGVAVGCGGLCAPAPGVGEIKRLYVRDAARGRGYGRLLLRALEQRAAAHGHGTLRLLTAAELTEARALYEAEGFRVVARVVVPDGPCELELEKPLHS